MLRLRLLSIGRDRRRWIGEGCQHYLKLLARYANVTSEILAAAKGSASLSPDAYRAREADRLEKAIGSDYLVALHDRGKRHDSLAFARRLERLQRKSRGCLAMVIGGAFGLDQRLLDRADLVLSLSDLTLTHELARLVLLEQLYRGFSILHNTAYHK